ncbi:MAG TPA: sugar phosphate nucleotidyltransferase [Gemmatimonadales bacterium]|jgi:mannose-1-phosphate guanylyltransferase
MRWAVVLAGGVGSRFWPLSSATAPKQFLNLAGSESLLLDAVRRILPLIPAQRVLIVTSKTLQATTRNALPMLPPENVLAEPRAASTAPALAWATAHAAQADSAASVLSMHADWAVGDAERFRAAATRAIELAESEDVLVTVGATPVRPETGYGYIVPGKPLGTGKRIARFVEKPTEDAARRLITEGALWNTGLFAWTAARLKAELVAHTPELAPALPLFEKGDAAAAFKALKPVSIDVGLFERTSRGAVIEGSFLWDDVGSWAALRRVRNADAAGNIAVGMAHLVDAKDCVVWSEDGPTVVFGIEGAVVVRAHGVTLVTTAAKAPDLKKLLDKLPRDLAGERGA